MCLGVPGKILQITESAGVARAGVVSFGGITKQVNLSFVPDAHVGDFVIVHVGFAISKVNEAEATRVFDYLQQIDELKELAPRDAIS
ncbi:MAG: HypC/HybG/HupF family hydrogenase formation chaperone [Candidatus Omnitrophica bacterium]|nr:HypC/HybG/HupF family hydrogenase formation chaperone [Candidatus Omnitrophota bacterium]